MFQVEFIVAIRYVSLTTLCLQDFLILPQVVLVLSDVFHCRKEMAFQFLGQFGTFQFFLTKQESFGFFLCAQTDNIVDFD